MEIAAISGIQHASPKSTTTESNRNNEEISAPIITSKAVDICPEFTNEENNVDKNVSTVVSEDHESIPLSVDTAQNVVKTATSSLPRDSSKPVRLKTSDKLTKVIETCKKLQKLYDQNAVKMGQEDEDVLNAPSGGAESCEKVNGATSGTDASEPVSEQSVNLPRVSEDDFCLMSDNPDNSSSSSNSINLSQSVNDDSSAPSSQCASDLTLKRFLFLFRPSDHEVLVRNKGSNMYRCNICGGMYRQKFSLKRHFLRTHINFRYISKSDISNCKITIPDEYVPQDSSLDCSNTPHGSKYRKKFKSSNAIFLENNKARVMPGLYICHICVGVQFDLEHELRDHYDDHPDAERKRFQCDKCTASFLKKQILSRHLASHGERVVRKLCKKCGAEFSSVSEYQKHLDSHSSGRVCKFCSKILSTSANRKRHEALHLGLKPYRCSHCGMSFAQSKDLDRHLKKQHSGLCYFCDSCNKLFPSQASLDVHLHEKHCDASPKKTENSPSPEPVNKPQVTKPASVPVAAPVKLKVCFVCKRSFQTIYAMMKHRTQAHPYHTKRRKNRKTMKQKMEQAKQAAAKDFNQGAKVRKPYGRPPKQNSNFSVSTVRRGRPPLDRSVKFGRHYDRSGPRFLTKRDRELAKKEEMEFYFSLSDKIAENLLHHVDGKTSQLSLKEYNFNDQRFPSCNFEERGRFPWSNYNFPNGYDVDLALNTRGHEVKSKLPENLSFRDKCLYATGLNRVQKLPQVAKDGASDKQVELVNGVLETVKTNQSPEINIKKMNLEERKKLVGRQVPIICLCYVCKEKFDSNAAFEEHCVNNHPNVDCSCIEIEGNKDSPPMIPGDLCKQDVTPDGVFFSWNVPPPLSETSLLKCTKCKSDFQTSFDLHSHIIKCGNLRSSPTHVWKTNTQKRIKRTMKSRMSFARQQAAVYAYAKKFKTPEKQTFGRNSAVAKCNDIILKSAEKSQFYKSGRLQTTSFTVDMNYFKTKPVKPTANTQSKRGRKSYATLSYRYRNASMQYSSSECPHCKEAFPSQSALNIHIQHHCIYSLSKRNENSRNLADLSSRNIAEGPSVTNILAPASAFSGWNKPTFVLNNDNLKNSTSKTSMPCSANANPPKTSNHCVKGSRKDLLLLKKDQRNSDSIEIPIDLSKHSEVETIVIIDPSRKKKGATKSKKSALDIAMKAINEYYQTSEQNEHISKLQKTVEKLTAPSEIASSLVQKPVSVKRVGRPKKIKRQGPFHLKKNLNIIKNSEVTNLKPISKLEETVKRLTENKVKSDFHKEQNTSPITTIDTAKSIAQESSFITIDTAKNSAQEFSFKAIDASKTTTQESPFKTIDAAKNTTQAEKISNVLPTINLVQPTFLTPVKMVGTNVKRPDATTVKKAASFTLKIANNFVPMIIYGDQGKSNNAIRLTNISQNKEKSPLSQNVCKISVDNSTSPGKTVNITENAIGSVKSLTPKKTLKDTSEVDLLSTSNTDSPDKKTEKTRLSSGSQGRISPSLESIVNSIKQKLHSQEQESSPQDDVAISWLEDEKFEIPSRPKLMLPTNSSSNSPLSVDNEPFCNISKDFNTSLEQEKSGSVDAVQSPHILSESETKLISSETVIDSPCENNKFASSVSQKIESLLESSIPSPKFETEIKNDKQTDCVTISTTTVQDSKIENVNVSPNDVTMDQGNEHVVSSPQDKQKDSPNLIVEKRTRKKVKVFTSVNKKTYAKKECDPQNQNPTRKKPGRPRKKPVELSICTTASESTKIIETSTQPDLKDEVSSQNLDISAPSIDNTTLAENEMELNDRDVNEESIAPSDNSKIEDTGFSESALPHSRQELSNLVGPESDDSQERPSCSTPDNANAILEDNSALPKMSNLRAFRTKFKQTTAELETFQSVEPKLTTEFGKNLASRMKEKMRLSFEIAASENIVRPEEGNNSDGVPDVSDINSLISDDDSEYLKEIKKEIEGLEPSKKHSCPFCMLEFAYLTNFRRHLRLCRARLETKEVEPVPCTSTTVLQYLPKKDEVEHSMLNLLRHQSRQTQMLKEAEKSSGSKVESKFSSYSCNVCHRIYLSLFKLLQHQVTHKLVAKDSPGTSAELDDAKDIEKYSVNELDERNIHDSEINKDIDPTDTKLIIDDVPIVHMLKSFNGEIGLTPVSIIQELNRDVIKDDIKMKHVSEIIEDVVKSSNAYAESECIQSNASKIFDSFPVSIKTEEQPLKRKRGRPFGWRKNANIVEDNLKSKVLKNNFKSCIKAKTVLFSIKRKAGKLHPGPIKRDQKKFFLTKSDIKTKKVVATTMTGKVIPHKQIEFTVDDVSANIVAKDETAETKLETLSIPTGQDTFLINQQKPKKAFKRALKKGTAVSNNVSGSIDNQTVVPKSPQRTKTESKINSLIDQSTDSNPAMKRPKGRTAVAMVTDLSVNKSECSLKRKPGRPPKTLQSPTPSTSQSQPGSARRFGKMMSRTIVIDSSDSEYDVPEKQEIIPKKKNLSKVCPICKGKFSASLALYRHIQLVHNRRSESTVIKTELPNTPKAVKRILPKSPAGSSNPAESKVLKKSSPKALSNVVDNSPKASKKLIAKSIDVIDSDTICAKILKKVKAKSPVHIADSDKSKRFRNSSKQVITIYDDDDDDFQVQAKVFKNVISKSVRINRDANNSKVGKKLSIKSETSSNDVNSTKNIKKDVSPSLNISSRISSPKVVKKPKSATNNNFDAGSTKGLKKGISTPFRRRTAKFITSDNSNANSPKVVKKFAANFGADDHSDADSTKSSKKNISKLTGINVDAISPKVVKKFAAKFGADDHSDANSTKSSKKNISKLAGINVDAISPKVVKKFAAKFGAVDHCDAGSIKSSKKNISKSAGIGVDAISPKVVKKFPAKFGASDHSDANSTKSPKRNVSKLAGINVNAISPKIVKKLAADSTSDTDSSKSFRKGSSKSLIVDTDACSPKVVKKLSAKSTANDNSDADSTKIVRKGISKSLNISSNTNSPKAVKRLAAKTVADDNSDASSTKSSNKMKVTVYNSDPDGAKHSRKSIPKSIIVDNSDADSDFSVKTDVSSLKVFKVCPICKEKFSANFILHRHIQLVHSRRSTPSTVKITSAKPNITTSRKVQSTAMKMKQVQSQSMRLKKMQSMKLQKMIDAASRSALSRQCRKPLPPLKRRWIKREHLIQDQI